LHNDLDLMYFRARYYDPNTGEFLSRDPLEYVDGMSQYRGYFVPNGMDPEGTSWLTYWMCVFQYSERADWLRHIFRGHGMPTHENSKGYNAFLHCNIACGLSTSCRKPWDDRETPGNNGGDMDIANNGCGFDVSDAQGGTNSGDCWKGCLEKWNSGKLTCIIKGVLAPCPPAPTDVDSEIFGHIDDEYDMPDIQTNGCF
jgi:hypothetical protein